MIGVGREQKSKWVILQLEGDRKCYQARIDPKTLAQPLDIISNISRSSLILQKINGFEPKSLPRLYEDLKIPCVGVGLNTDVEQLLTEPWLQSMSNGRKTRGVSVRFWR